MKTSFLKTAFWKEKIALVLCAGIVLSVMIASLLREDIDRSVTERRSLASFPQASLKAIWQGSFQEKLDTYLSDQIAFRDSWLRLWALVERNVLLQLDVNKIVSENGSLISLMPEMNEDSLAYAASLFSSFYTRFLEGTECSIYLSIIPDKAFFLENPIYVTLDYDLFFEQVSEQCGFAQNIDISGLLDLSDYYTGDPHWKIENLQSVAEKLADSMGVSLEGSLDYQVLDETFGGLYSAQSFSPGYEESLLVPDEESLQSLKLYDYSTGQKKERNLIDTDQTEDAYQSYLSGNAGLLELVNETVHNGKELVLFRDSFASALAFHLALGYERIWLVDLRDFNSALLSRFIDFTDQDVLFLYSTTVLNDAYQLR